MKKWIALLLALTLMLAMAACTPRQQAPENDGSEQQETLPPQEPETSDDGQTAQPADEPDPAQEQTPEEPEPPQEPLPASVTPIQTSQKLGMLLPVSEGQPYAQAQVQALQAAAEELGFAPESICVRYDVPDGTGEAAAEPLQELLEEGCAVIVSCCRDNEETLVTYAGENPEVIFVSIGGSRAAGAGLVNYTNAYTRLYEASYVAGTAAGVKLEQLIADYALGEANFTPGDTIKLGYVGARRDAETLSAATAFFLGVRSRVSNVSMQMSYTEDWTEESEDPAYDAAYALIYEGCVILGQHVDDDGVARAAQEANENSRTVFFVGSNVSFADMAPEAYITAAVSNWEVYYTELLTGLLAGKAPGTDWCGGYDVGAVAVTAPGYTCPEETAQAADAAADEILTGKLAVFDTGTFTVGGTPLESYTAAGGEAVSDGVFRESALRSAPYFDLRIDGITDLIH